MKKEVLVDSDILSYFFRGDRQVFLKFSEYSEYFDTINISILTYYEIVSGLKFRDSRKRLGEFKEFVIDSCLILPLTEESVEISSDIYSKLRKEGTPIDDVDLLIAGTAINYNLIMVTNNVKHFGRINSLEIENWKG